MFKKYRICFLGLTFLLLVIASCAKKPAVIKGTVTDDEGKPLGGAAIFSVPQRYSTLTDTLGQFTIEGVEAGQYSTRLSASAIPLRTSLAVILVISSPLVCATCTSYTQCTLRILY